MSNEERRELDRKVGKDFLHLDGEELERFINDQEYKRRNMKEGDDVIHLQFNGMLVPHDDVLYFEKELQSRELQLSYYDDSNSFSASIVEMIAIIAINSRITEWILSNIAWELTWNFFLKILNRSFEKFSEIRQHNPDYFKNRTAGVGISFEFENENGKERVNFTVTADTDPKLAKEARKMMEIILKQHRKGSRYEQWTLDKQKDWKRDSRYDVPE